MAIGVPQNEEISGGGKNGGKKGVGSAIRWRGVNRGAYTLRNESGEELLREMLTLHNQRDGVVVRASASQSVDLGFISLDESYQKTKKWFSQLPCLALIT